MVVPIAPGSGLQRTYRVRIPQERAALSAQYGSASASSGPATAHGGGGSSSSTAPGGSASWCRKASTASAAASGALGSSSSGGGSRFGTGSVTTSSVPLWILAAAVCVLADTAQLLLVALAALFLVAVRQRHAPGGERPGSSVGRRHSPREERPTAGLPSSGSWRSAWPSRRQASQTHALARRAPPAEASHGGAAAFGSGAPSFVAKDMRQFSKVPVQPPSFRAATFDAQVDELVAQLNPTPESDRIATELAQVAQRAIQAVLPEIEVAGYATGDVVRGTAFGVAVPEVDLVASGSPQLIIQHLQGRLTKGGLSVARLDARKLQKSAIRMCTDQLVSVGGFKFRRSAFRGQEPKVTLMAPPTLGVSGKGIPIDFSVNSSTPLYNSVLLQAAAEIDPRVRPFVVFVRRWAKDRGVCHAAKGHLPPYAWTLLSLYFMQVGLQGSPLLPPLQGFKLVTGPMVRPHDRRAQQRWAPPDSSSQAARMTCSGLFREFVRFYGKGVDWHKEAVSVRLGRRAPANVHLMLHIIVNEDGTTQAGPGIEDPFEPARNLGTSLTAVGVARLQEELARASELLDKGSPLSVLLEPWAPLERSAAVAVGYGAAPLACLKPSARGRGGCAANAEADSSGSDGERAIASSCLTYG